MRLILHADDLGISPVVNDAIFGLMDAEKLTSASILANGPAFDDAVRGTRHFKRCCFGLHLNVTEFAPLSSFQPLEPLLANGRFRRVAIYGPGTVDAVFEEWNTQLKRLRQAGVEISHLDSHHHAHTHLALLPSLERLCRENSMRRVRLRHTFTVRSGRARWRIDNRLYNSYLRRSFSCTDEFGPFAAFPAEKIVPDATVELMSHPGNPAYEAETEALAETVDADFRDRYQCIPYRDLE